MSTVVPLNKILRLYQKKGLSVKQVGERLGVTHQAISYRLKVAGVAIRPPASVKFPDKKTIEQLYVKEGLGAREVAERLKVPFMHVRLAMNEYGIASRPRGRTPKFRRLRELGVGESIELPNETKHPHINFYGMAKKAGIRVSVHVVDAETVRVTRSA